MALLENPNILILFVPVAVVVYLVRQYYHHGLQRYPGPFIARLSNSWRFVDVWCRRPDVTHIQLHRKYGDIVRLGPNTLSFANPSAVKDIYGINKGYVKSDFYPVQMSLSKGDLLPSLFSTTEERFHANLRRCVNGAFSMTSLVEYEPLVDETTTVFLDQTEKLFTRTATTCDFYRWLQFYAFDVIGTITYSRRHGFIDKNEDIDGIVDQIGRIFDYAGPVGQMPWIDSVMWKNPILCKLSKWGLWDNSFAVAVFARTRLQERLGVTDEEKQKQKHEDLLSMFLRAKEAYPQFMTDKLVLTMATSMAFAGSETTAISLAAVFYYILKEPRCLQLVQQEIENAVKDGTIEGRSTGIVSWPESQKLPYLDACIKEAFRMHPAAGLPLERVVPPQGATICGQHVEGGTIVGCSAWVLHRREEVFGSDVDIYRPERWLDATTEQLKAMNSTLFQFGAGSRTCIGKNISLMEIYKLVPSFLRRFEVQLAHPEKEWRLHNAWFVKQLDFEVKFSLRNRS